MKFAAASSLCAALILLSFATAPASNGEIGLFFDPGGQHCLEDIPCTQSITLYVYALLEGASLNGITTAEYGIRIGQDGNSDPGWMFEEEFVSNAVVVGKGAFFPLDTRDIEPRSSRQRGVNLGFNSCQLGDGSKVLLETVEVYNVGCDVGPLPILVTNHDVSSNQFYQCPLFTLCDAPAYTKVCLGQNLRTCRNPMPPYAADATCSTSGSAVVNPEPGTQSPCALAVEQQTWSAVKGIYR